MKKHEETGKAKVMDDVIFEDATIKQSIRASAVRSSHEVFVAYAVESMYLLDETDHKLVERYQSDDEAMLQYDVGKIIESMLKRI